MTSIHTISATFLPASAAGLSPCAWLIGVVPYGPAAVHVSHSVEGAETEEGQRTLATSGRNFSGSSPSAALQQSLENRLRARMGVDGSPEYVLTWRHWDMSSGPPICALQAYLPRTQDSVFSGWPTPVVTHFHNATSPGVRKRGLRRPDKTGWAAWLIGWRYEDLPKSIRGSRKSIASCLPAEHGRKSNGSNAKTEHLGVLNPEHSRWLMGYPEAWRSTAVMAMQSSRK